MCLRCPQGLHDVPGVRLPLQTSYGASPSPPPHAAVLMYSAAGGDVTLQLSELDGDKGGGLAGVLARLAHEDATLSISLQDAAGELSALAEGGAIDVLLGTATAGEYSRLFVPSTSIRGLS